MPEFKKPFILIVNANNKEVEKEIVDIIKTFSKTFKVKSCNIKKNGMDMIIELRTEKGKEMIDQLSELEQIKQVSLLSQDGEVRY